MPAGWEGGKAVLRRARRGKAGCRMPPRRPACSMPRHPACPMPLRGKVHGACRAAGPAARRAAGRMGGCDDSAMRLWSGRGGVGGPCSCRAGNFP
jgi:hypothetical protein